MIDPQVGNIKTTGMPAPLWRPLSDGRMMEVVEQWDFSFVRSGIEIHAYIKAGEVIDGASIPRGAWALVGSPYVGFHRVPAQPHDIGYAGTKGRVYDHATGEIIEMERREWDQLFLSSIIFATNHYDEIVDKIEEWRNAGWPDANIIDQLVGRGFCMSDAEAREALKWDNRSWIERFEDCRIRNEMYGAVRAFG